MDYAVTLARETRWGPRTFLESWAIRDDASMFNKNRGILPEVYAYRLHICRCLFQVLLVFRVHAVTENVSSIGDEMYHFVVFLVKSSRSFPLFLPDVYVPRLLDNFCRGCDILHSYCGSPGQRTADDHGSPICSQFPTFHERIASN